MEFTLAAAEINSAADIFCAAQKTFDFPAERADIAPVDQFPLPREQPPMEASSGKGSRPRIAGCNTIRC
ncbi:MAG: hypothetical protein H6883_10560 [Rhodobiaceae bacterium]|nr:hypothetical protein [Rhodobiaceae bacterium]